MVLIIAKNMENITIPNPHNIKGFGTSETVRMIPALRNKSAEDNIIDIILQN